MQIERLTALILFAGMIFVGACAGPPGSLEIEPPEAAWDTSEEEEGEDEESPLDTDTGSETEEEEEEEDTGEGVEPEIDTDTETESESESESEAEADTGPDTDTGTGNQPMEGKSCSEGLLCIVQGAEMLSCLSETDPQAQALLGDLVLCMVTAGCMGDLADTAALLACLTSSCNTELMACVGDNGLPFP